MHIYPIELIFFPTFLESPLNGDLTPFYQAVGTPDCLGQMRDPTVSSILTPHQLGCNVSTTDACNLAELEFGLTEILMPTRLPLEATRKKFFLS